VARGYTTAFVARCPASPRSPCAPQIVQREAIVRRRERPEADVVVHERAGGGFVERARRGPTAHLPAPVLVHRLGGGRGRGEQHHAGEAEQARLAGQRPRRDDRRDLSAHAVADEEPAGGRFRLDRRDGMIDHPGDGQVGGIPRIAEAGEVDRDGIESGIEAGDDAVPGARTAAQRMKQEKRGSVTRRGCHGFG
jgi:hypothetical protein